MEDFEVKNNDFLRQFEATIKDGLVKLEYAEQEKKIFLSKFVIPENLKEEGYHNAFLTKVFDYIKDKERIKVVPTSKEVKKFFKANKRKYTDLLPVGINI